MGAIRWRDVLGPPSLVLSSALLITAIVPAAIAAGPLRPPPSPATPCPTAEELGEGVQAAVSRSSDNESVEGSLSTETVLTRQGEETGQLLSIEGAEQAVLVSLPAESFVAEPVGELVVYGSHTPAAGSEVRAVLLDSGCDLRLARPGNVVRSAVIGPQGDALYVHSVTEAERRDSGIVRHDLVTGETSLVVPPIPDSEHFGRTFATLLEWSAQGDELAVQSCGFEACRTRILDTASGTLETYAGEGHGALIGFDRQHVFVFDICHGAPCNVLAIERASGIARLLVEEAFDARFEPLDGSSQLVVELAAGMVEVAP